MAKSTNSAAGNASETKVLENANLPAVADKGTAVALADEADALFGAHAGAGMENVTAADLLIPRITILQALSPQLKPTKPEYIDGAKAGEICDVAMGETFGNSIKFLPVHYVKQWLEWAPRNSNKGLVAIHATPDIMQKTRRNDRNQPVLENGNLISETAQFFGFNLSAPGYRRCFLPMASTQLKVARKWMNLATSEVRKRPDGTEFCPPLYFRVYELKVVDESNAEGDWHAWKVERDLPMTQFFGDEWRDMFAKASDFHESLISGAARGDISGMSEGAEPANNSEGEM